VTADRYHLLTAKVDGFFARVEARHGDQMQCGSGCADCCHTRLTVTAVEAAAIEDHVAAMAPAARAELAALAARPVDPATIRCAALGDDDRCRIYAARPIVCRSHGAPIKLGASVTACHRNFTARGPAAADPDCVLDQTTLSALVLAVNGGGSERTDLAALLVALLR